MKPTYFRSAAELRAWLEAHHADRSEVWVGFHKAGSGKTGITYAEALDEALCFGWIDAVRKGLGDHAWTIRLTPRKPGSIWSKVNVAHVARLTKEGRMRAAGLAATKARKPERTARYSFEQGAIALSPDDERALKKRKGAWSYWSELPASYKKAAAWWVLSAKKEETRARRLASLVDHCAEGKRLRQFTAWKAQRA